MFAGTDHPFHIQTIAFFAALAPIVALFVLLIMASLARQRRRKSTSSEIQRAKLWLLVHTQKGKAV
jgi:hypothetical protein